MIWGYLFLAVLLALNIYVWVWHTPEFAQTETLQAQREKCETAGGIYFNNYRDVECVFPPYAK